MISTTEHASDLGRWSAASRAAAEPLRPFVQGYFGSESILPAPLRERHLPSFGVSLVLNFAEPHQLLDRDGANVQLGRRAWVVGLQASYRLADAIGERAFLIIQLTPSGAHHILRERMDRLSDEIVDLDEIDPLFARSLLARSESSHGWAERFDAVEGALIERLETRRADPSLADAALRNLQAGNGDIGGLATALGCSHRRLIAAFRDEVGLTPKAVGRLMRFERTVAVINRRHAFDHPSGKPYLEGRPGPVARGRQGVGWTDLALGCGYYDQSHFINEFRAFSGVTPMSFWRQLDHPGAAA